MPVHQGRSVSSTCCKICSLALGICRKVCHVRTEMCFWEVCDRCKEFTPLPEGSSSPPNENELQYA